MKYLVYFTTHKMAPLGATKSMKGYSCQCITHVGCCIKRKLRENIKVCVNVLPTSYRQVTDTLPTVGPLSADCRPTVGRLSADISGKICWPSVGQLSADSRPTGFLGALLHNYRERKDKIFIPIILRMCKLRSCDLLYDP